MESNTETGLTISSQSALARQRTLTPSVWAMISEMSPVMHRSRLFGVSSPEAAAAIMLKGYELGMPISASFEFLQVVQGKPTLSPRGALALILQCGELASIKIEDRQKNGQAWSCFCQMKRTNGLEYSLEYTMDDAKRTGQVKSGSAWESYPANMLRWRCVGFVADVVFPDVIGGLKRADEFGAPIDANGDVIDGQWTTAPASAQFVVVEPSIPTTPQPAPVEQPAVTLESLLAIYSAEQIIVAAEGRLPSTDDELAAVAAKLAGGA